MNFLKKLLFSLLLLQLLSTVYSECSMAHCYNLNGNLSAAVNQNFSNGCSMAIDSDLNGVRYNIIATPGTILKHSNFTKYNKVCDNGSSNDVLNFYMQKITSISSNSVISNQNNTGNSSTPISTGDLVCKKTGDCFERSGYYWGEGNLPEIIFNFNQSGGYNYKLIQLVKPIAGRVEKITIPGTGEHNIPLILPSQDQNIYIGVPSLIIVGPADTNSGFFEKDGNYEKEIVFTLFNKSPLDLNLTNYEIKCAGQNNITCSIDKNYVNWPIESFTGKKIIRGKININKTQLPSTITFYLDVNYVSGIGSSTIENYGACQMFANNSVSSAPTTLRYGLLDQQKFQIGLISDTDVNNCVGENGMIGQTGEMFVPRVNVGFGGTVDSEGYLISIDECDLEDINGLPNDNWVYCSKKEALVEISAKIAKAWEIQKRINNYKLSPSTTDDLLIEDLELEKQKYLSFNLNIRTQSFSQEEINNSINDFKNINRVFSEKIGIELLSGEISNESEILEGIFSKAVFSYAEGVGLSEDNPKLLTGTYPVNITFDTNNISSNSLFEEGFVLNENVSIGINFGQKISSPSYNWFFYDYGDNDFNSIEESSITNFTNTNINNRGKIFFITKGLEETNFSNYTFFPTYATPIFVKLKTDENGVMDSDFTVTESGPNNFSYWTGFASSISNGCVDITKNSLTTSPTLPFRESDSVNLTSNKFYFDQYSSVDSVNDPNSTVYLETILFWPNTINDTKYMTAPFEIYTKNIDSNNQRVNIDDNNFKIENVNSLFNAIKENKVCVHQEFNAISTSWTLFWNTKAIYDSISTRKRTVIAQNRDANICEVRETLGG